MAFDIKELMVDITKASPEQWGCHPSILPPTCGCTYHTVMLCHPSLHTTTLVPCNLGTYTCFAGSIVTCGGTIYCAGTEDPTLLFKGMDREVLEEIKAQLQNALKEVEQREKNLAEAPAKSAKDRKK
jgi:hypothetical protein